jgi:hypothetical protein
MLRAAQFGSLIQSQQVVRAGVVLPLWRAPSSDTTG